MPNIPHELFLLSTNLSQLKDEKLILKIFIESINSIFPGYDFEWAYKFIPQTENSIVISINEKIYGHICYSTKIGLTTEEQALIHNAAQLLAILLEKLEQESLLNDKKNFLDFLVEEKTISLQQNQSMLEKQKDAINEKNKELILLNSQLVTLNTELKEVILELQVAKEKAEQSEEIVKEKSEEIENFFSSSIDLLCIANTDGYFLRLNKEWEKALGYTIEELEGRKIFDFVHPDDIDLTLQANAYLDSQKTVPYYLNRYLCKDGSYKWIEWKSYPHGNKIYATARDITTRIQIEKELISAKEKAEDSEANLREAQRISKLGNFYLNLVSTQLSWSKECYSLFDINESIDNNNLREEFEKKIHPDDYNALQKLLEKSIQKNEGFTFEYRAIVNNSVKNILLITEPVFKTNNQLTGLKGTLQDISDQKKIEQELIKAKETAEESDRLKTSFLQNMSHEIRTPMNAIMGFAELLNKNFDNKAKLEKFTKIINQRCSDLLDIINDILDISKIESGQLPINIEECDLNILFNDLSQFFKEYQDRNGKQHIKLELNSNRDSSKNIILTDKIKLKQIFINLITNAFKFTDEGIIKGGCEIDDNNNIRFFVSDTGIGIPDNKKEAIFERFLQLDQNTNRNIGGTGLGLSIVKGLVNLLGGEIFLESKPGKGSTFNFTMPYKTTIPTSTPPTVIFEPIKECFRNKIILIVEDDVFNFEYLNEILQETGMVIHHVDNGRDAVNFSVTQSLDLVLMDVRLPIFDGYIATQQILQQKPTLKIIAQTAYASFDEKQKALDAGCIDYISKPAKRELLLTLIQKHLTS
jgi:PAS domain S-box-containing protein